jgi:predicted Zn-dependent protease
MARKKAEGNTRQIYASVREDLYLAAKARATELRMPLKEFVEMALDLALSGPDQPSPSPASDPSVWDDEYLRMQAEQPVGSPVELSKEEAQRVIKAAFGSDAGVSDPQGGAHSEVEDPPKGEPRNG